MELYIDTNFKCDAVNKTRNESLKETIKNNCRVTFYYWLIFVVIWETITFHIHFKNCITLFLLYEHALIICVYFILLDAAADRCGARGIVSFILLLILFEFLPPIFRGQTRFFTSKNSSRSFMRQHCRYCILITVDCCVMVSYPTEGLKNIIVI